MPNLSDLFSAGGFLKWDGAGNADADYSSQTPAQLAADAAFTGAFAPLPTSLWVPAPGFGEQSGTPSRGIGGGAPVWSLANGVDSGVTAPLILPANWLTFDVELWWANGGAGAGNVRWRYTEQTVTGAGDTLAQASISATVATAGAVNVIVETTLASGRTCPPAGQVLGVGIERTGTNGADTLANAARLLGAWLYQAS